MAIPDDGPILRYLPPPPTVERRLTLANRLNGHISAPAFLPAGLSTALDSLRVELLARRERVVTQIETRNTLLAKFKTQDRDHIAVQRSAHRAGTPMPADQRTPAEQREAALAAIDDALWSAVDVLAETADKTIAVFRRDEDALLEGLQARLPAIEEKRREAARLLEDAKADEFQVRRLGMWVQGVSDDSGILGKQPHPPKVPMPEGFNPSALRDALKRPWHSDKPSGPPNRLVEELPPPPAERLIWPLDPEPTGAAR